MFSQFFSQKLSVCVSHEVISYLRDSPVPLSLDNICAHINSLQTNLDTPVNEYRIKGSIFEGKWCTIYVKSEEKFSSLSLTQHKLLPDLK